MLSYLTQWNNTFPQIQLLVEIEKDLQAKQARWQQQEQKLSIGIMGQVKAGKSSFLNALLFAGKPILPEAATPKTANLTKISYGDAFTLRVDYYTDKEWQEIQHIAQSGSDTIEAKVSQELIAMANKLNGDEIHRCLSVGNESVIADDLDGLQGILNQYTGSDGSHTPLVKSTEIELPIDDLKGFEVVDTPGMNDPVASRTQKTREYMANCDVVFFLSRSSQFLDKSDDELLRDQLPNKGVKRLVLVAGQFDSAILDDGYDRDSLAETEQNLKTRLTRVAVTKANELADRKMATDDNQHALLIESLSNPVFASTFAYGFAHWPQEQWTKTMQHVHNELLELADEWDEYEYTQQDWQRLANFEVLQQAFDQAKHDRSELLEQQKRSILPDSYNRMNVQLLNLVEAIKQRIEFLQSKDLADIEKEQNVCETKMTAISSALSFTLAQARNNAQQEASELLSQLKQDQISFSQLTTRTGSRTEESSREVSCSTWYKPWTWGNTRTVYSTYTVSYDYLNPHDAIEQVNRYGAQSAQQIVRAFGKLISSEVLKLTLKKALLDELDTKSEDFDPTLFKAMLENALSQLMLPRFDIQLGDTTSLISANFSGEVTNSSDMQNLRLQLNKALEQVLGKIQSEFEKQFGLVVNQLKEIEITLSQSLMQNIQQQLADMREQVINKKDEISRFDELLSQVTVMQQGIKDKLKVL
ncbi:dynamin family protein [Photobacterium damselae]|uniref:dynamin family protein n=1 Tax=Photobacterium damselae TaxID=38293 RepID=UPI001EDE3DAA|nr:dynamin family protein [Photobacterium damselae]MCG3844859.1 dynamin family protein [Photobacterium damselae]